MIIVLAVDDKDSRTQKSFHWQMDRRQLASAEFYSIIQAGYLSDNDSESNLEREARLWQGEARITLSKFIPLQA